MKIDAQAIGQRIRRSRKNANLTQEQLAELADISVVYVSKLENGQRSPSLETLIDICNVLHCSMDDILEDHLTSANPSPPNQIDTLFLNASTADRKFLTQLITVLRSYL
ncbi:MAG: helix-turn-helix transcriptional regulator [Clostridia bacterium]|nr:helix-turn-helix transcriptional regulator [Clostridia bacterium]